MFKWFSRKDKGKRVTGRTLFEGSVKRMDVRYGSFLWLKDHDTGKEYCADVSIERVIIDLPDGVLSKRIEVRTKDGLVKLKVRTILENMADRNGYYKFIHFKRPLHVKVFGTPGGSVELTIGEGGETDGLRKEDAEEDGGQGEKGDGREGQERDEEEGE